MNSLFEAVPYLSAYWTSFLVLAMLSFSVLTQAMLTGPLAYIKEEQVPGLPLRQDHSKLSFRAVRAFGNSAESFPAFGWALLVAIAAGTSPTLVNWLACLHFGFRIAFAALYYSGIGKVAGGPRSMAFAGGMISNLVLAGAAIYTLLTA